MSCRTALTGPVAWAHKVFSEPGSATKFVLGLCLLSFAMLVLIQGSLPFGLFGPPADRSALLGVGGLAGRLGELQPWRLLSATFAHASVLHLGMNMYALLSFGRAFEERFGGARLLLAYAATGIFGFWVSGLVYGPYGPPTVGASGALFGFIGIEVGYLVATRDPAAKQVFLNYLLLAVAMALVFSVNNWAHLGGFVLGLPIGFAFAKKQPKKAPPLWVSVGALVVVVASVLSIALSLATLYFVRQMS